MHFQCVMLPWVFLVILYLNIILLLLRSLTAMYLNIMGRGAGGDQLRWRNTAISHVSIERILLAMFVKH